MGSEEISHRRSCSRRSRAANERGEIKMKADLITYFAFLPSSRMWKIGRTKNISQRMQSLRSEHGREIELRAIFLHEEIKESDCLRMFAGSAVKGTREWFRDSPFIKAFLSSQNSLLSYSGRVDFRLLADLEETYPGDKKSVSIKLSKQDFTRIKQGGIAGIIGYLHRTTDGEVAFVSLKERARGVPDKARRTLSKNPNLRRTARHAFPQ